MLHVPAIFASFIIIIIKDITIRKPIIIIPTKHYISSHIIDITFYLEGIVLRTTYHATWPAMLLYSVLTPRKQPPWCLWKPHVAYDWTCSCDQNLCLKYSLKFRHPTTRDTLSKELCGMRHLLYSLSSILYPFVFKNCATRNILPRRVKDLFCLTLYFSVGTLGNNASTTQKFLIIFSCVCLDKHSLFPHS